MKKIFTFLIILLSTSTIFAQSNKVELQFGGYRIIPSYLDFVQEKNNILSTIGIQYERSLSKRFSVAATYSQMSVFSNSKDQLYAKMSTQLICPVGGSKELTHHVNYSMFDVSAAYHIIHSPKSTLSVLAGLTMAMGQDKYTVLSDGGIFSKYEYEKARYYGAIAGLKYSYALGNSRFSLGAQGLTRIIPGEFPSIVQYSALLAYRF